MHVPIMNTWRKLKAEQGFTIVELLIVIVVIGILAVISFVAYSNIQQSARASVAQNTTQQVAKKVRAYASENSDQYPSTLALAGVNSSDNTLLRYSADNIVSPRTFCITATTNGVSYFVTSTNSSPTAGTCPGHESGVAPQVTNLMRNPDAEGSLSGWTARTNSTVAASSAEPILGSQSVLMTATSVNPSVTMGAPGGPYPIAATPNTNYSISVYIKPLDVPAQARVSMDSFNGTSYITGSAVSGPIVNVAVGQTARLTLTATTTAGANRLQAYVVIASGATAGNRWLIDGSFVAEGSSLFSYADGFSSGWVWGGTPHSSTSSGPLL